MPITRDLIRKFGNVQTRAQIFNAYVATLAPLIELRMNIASGTNIPNFGSLGSAQDGTLTIGAGALLQDSALGMAEAISWDGANTKVTIPNSASVDAISKYTWVFLCKANTLGEGNNGRLYEYASLGNTNCNIQATGAIRAGQRAATTNALSLSSSSFIPAFGLEHLMAIQYDDTTDRKIHFFKGLSNVVTEATYTTQTAASGVEQGTGSIFNIGNRTANDVTWDGLFTRVLHFNKILSGAELLQLTTLAGFP